MKNKKDRKITEYKDMTIMVSEDIRGNTTYYIKEKKSLSFNTVDEAEDYIDLLKG